MARIDGKDRGLRPVTKPDGKVWWQARLYHHGQEWRSTPTPSKQEARAIYTAKKAELREAQYFPQVYQAKQAQQVTIADLFALALIAAVPRPSCALRYHRYRNSLRPIRNRIKTGHGRSS